MVHLMTNKKLTAMEQQLLENATELVPYLQQFGRRIDEERHIPDEVIKKVSDAGLFKLGTLKNTEVMKLVSVPWWKLSLKWLRGMVQSAGWFK